MVYHSKTNPLGCLESTNAAKIGEAVKWLPFNNLEMSPKTKPVRGLESMGVAKFGEADMWLLFNKLEAGCLRGGKFSAGGASGTSGSDSVC